MTRFLQLFEFALVPEIIWVGQGRSIVLKAYIPDVIRDHLYESSIIYAPKANRLYVSDGFHAGIMLKHDLSKEGDGKIYGRALQGLVEIYTDFIPMAMMVGLRMIYGREATITTVRGSDYVEPELPPLDKTNPQI